MDKRSYDCPKCGHKFLVREDNKVICCNCDWSVESRRSDDNLLREKVPPFYSDWAK